MILRLSSLQWQSLTTVDEPHIQKLVMVFREVLSLESRGSWGSKGLSTVSASFSVHWLEGGWVTRNMGISLLWYWLLTGGFPFPSERPPFFMCYRRHVLSTQNSDKCRIERFLPLHLQEWKPNYFLQTDSLVDESSWENPWNPVQRCEWPC